MSAGGMSPWKDEFASFVRGHENRVLQFLLRRGVDPHDAEDVSQEIFLTLWKNWYRAIPGKETQFLFGIARKVLRAYFRNRAKQAVAMDPGWIDTGVEMLREKGPFPDPGTDDPRRDSDTGKITVRAALSGLSPRQRQVVELVWLKGLTRAEAATRLGITEGALRAHEKRALDRLRELNRRQ